MNNVRLLRSIRFTAMSNVRRLRRSCFTIAAMSIALAFPVQAQRTHVILVQGLSGEPSYAGVFKEIVASVAHRARTTWNVADSSLIVLTEDGTNGSGKSTKENVDKAFATLSKRVAPGDVILVMLVGHGGGEGTASRVNMPGPDATATDYANWLSGFTRQRVVFVNAASASGDFLPVVAGPQRIVVTATKSAMQRNESIFGEYFARGMGSTEADSDKDGRISVLEAFGFATREVARAYKSADKLQTEQAQISDSTLARNVVFAGSKTVTDPKIAALMAERQELESQVAALRLSKGSMDAAKYDAELERLLLAIAEKTRAIRAGGGSE